MTKVDRFLDSLAKDERLAGASFMGLTVPLAVAMLKSYATPDELEALINEAVAKWESA